jgi:hypothetical protein
MRSVMAFSADVRRMIVVMLALSTVGIAGSIWRGDSVSTTLGHLLVGLCAGGFVFGCYFWARRKR